MPHTSKGLMSGYLEATLMLNNYTKFNQESSEDAKSQILECVVNCFVFGWISRYQKLSVTAYQLIGISLSAANIVKVL